MSKKEPIFRHDLHIDLWDWLAKNPSKRKNDAPEYLHGESVNNCHACDYNYYTDGGDLICNACPFRNQWGGMYDGVHCRDRGGPYNQWDDSFDWGKVSTKTLVMRSKLARQIRDLPLRKDWDWQDVEAPK